MIIGKSPLTNKPKPALAEMCREDMDMYEKKSKISNAVLVLICVAVVFAIFILILHDLYSYVLSLETQIRNIRSNQSTEIESMRRDLSSEIDSINKQIEQIVQTSKLSFDESVLIQRYNGPTSTADVEISFYLKEYNAEDDVNVTAQGLNGHVYTAAASLSAAGRYTAAITLPVQDEYVLNFISKGLSTKIGELTELSLAEELCKRFYYYIESRQSGGFRQNTRIVTFIPKLSNNVQENEALKIKKLSLVVESGGAVIRTWDLLPYLSSGINDQSINPNNISGQFQIPLDEIEFDESNESQHSSTPYKVAQVKLIIYDHMGVRYEEVDSLEIYTRFDMISLPDFAGGFVPVGALGWFIEDGEYAWNYIHIVRQ